MPDTIVYDPDPFSRTSVVRERDIETDVLEKLRGLKYACRPEITTPIFEANASLQKIEDTQASMRITEDLFQKGLHAYTITHAIRRHFQHAA